MKIRVWNIRSAQKPPCMKHWNVHMEHVIEWETVSPWMRQLSGTADNFKIGTGFSFSLCACRAFTYWAPWRTRSAPSKCPRRASFHNPLLLNALKKYKSGLIKSGKDQFPGLCATLAGHSAMMCLLLLSPLECRRTFSKTPWGFYHNHTSCPPHPTLTHVYPLKHTHAHKLEHTHTRSQSAPCLTSTSTPWLLLPFTET